MLDLIKKRQAQRAYKNLPVEPEKIDRILEAARLAPSACNAQPWKFIVVDEPELKNQIADATSSRVLGMNHWTKQAAILIVIVEDKANIKSRFGGIVKRRHFPIMDLGIAASHISLQAAYEGLGTCFIGWFNERRVKKILKIPRGKRPQLIMTLGYSDSEIREKIRKDKHEVISFNFYT